MKPHWVASGNIIPKFGKTQVDLFFFFTSKHAVGMHRMHSPTTGLTVNCACCDLYHWFCQQCTEVCSQKKVLVVTQMWHMRYLFPKLFFFTIGWNTLAGSFLHRYLVQNRLKDLKLLDRFWPLWIKSRSVAQQSKGHFWTNETLVYALCKLWTVLWIRCMPSSVSSALPGPEGTGNVYLAAIAACHSTVYGVPLVPHKLVTAFPLKSKIPLSFPFSQKPSIKFDPCTGIP